jgi:hypothetical protein
VTLETAIVEYIALTVSLGLLVFGVSILVFIRRRGGPELALAKLLADSRRRTVFLGALCTSLAALFAIGLSGSVAGLIGSSPTEMAIVETAFFLVGAAGIFVLMVDAIRNSPLTLEEGWNLKEAAARVSNLSADPLPPTIDIPPTPYSGDGSIHGPRP